ncbi:tyrosinase family oxidase copper chaperone [Streptomyces sp. NPDC056738]|uniref:tyrosinase family oxidase copper chaperone n=1 Tax=Streptomyces sp. NPDC056738 TaxID=3345933 RepID=UPI00368BB42A
MFARWMPGRVPRRGRDGRVPDAPARGRGTGRVAGGLALTRRGAMRGLLVSAVGVALAPVVAASRPPRHRGRDLSFDEMYHGRHILGTRGGSDGRAAYGGDEWQVTVDGRPLHLMRRADGSYLSMVDHYESYPTPLAAARAAVDQLGPAEQLRSMGGMGSMGSGAGGSGGPTIGTRDGGTEGSGHHHGVHA